MLCPHFQLNKPLYTTTSFLRQSCLCVRNKVARTLILFNFFKNLLNNIEKDQFCILRCFVVGHFGCDVMSFW
uniref:Uncharacterized protein n=2 Tax=Meloidogyne TaxID=189290 RepID=A0A6V7WYK3_MELEN|nr:unnamed protein product [Meloidogyne enterolobii]